MPSWSNTGPVAMEQNQKPSDRRRCVTQCYRLRQKCWSIGGSSKRIKLRICWLLCILSAIMATTGRFAAILRIKSFSCQGSAYDKNDQLCYRKETPYQLKCISSDSLLLKFLVRESELLLLRMQLNVARCCSCNCTCSRHGDSIMSIWIDCSSGFFEKPPKVISLYLCSGNSVHGLAPSPFSFSPSRLYGAYYYYMTNGITESNVRPQRCYSQISWWEEYSFIEKNGGSRLVW